jgi:hypothetical protein
MARQHPWEREAENWLAWARTPGKMTGPGRAIFGSEQEASLRRRRGRASSRRLSGSGGIGGRAFICRCD